MADQRKGGGSTGTAGGTDVEPLRGGMKEIDRDRTGPGPEHRSYPGQQDERETAERKDPPAPVHDVHVSEGGLTPQGMPGQGATPTPPRGEIEATAGKKIEQERGEVENESANAPRRDPSSRGVDR
jgi:hypothetical protein